MGCTCNPVTLEAEFWNGEGSISVGGRSFNSWADLVTTYNSALGEEPD